MHEVMAKVGPAATDEQRMDRFLEAYREAWADPASGRLADLWARDGKMMHPEFTEPIVGRDAVMDYLRRMLELAPDLTVRPLAAAASGDTVFIHFQGEGTFAGKKIVWEGVDRYDLDGDVAVYGIGFFDPGPVRNALGVDSS